MLEPSKNAETLSKTAHSGKQNRLYKKNLTMNIILELKKIHFPVYSNPFDYHEKKLFHCVIQRKRIFLFNAVSMLLLKIG